MEGKERHKCFISFKKENEAYKKTIKDSFGDKLVDKSLNQPIDSQDEDYIMRQIREKHLSNSTVTIFLIGMYSNENLGEEEQTYIKRELQASLYDGEGNTRNGILGVVLPEMYDNIFKGSYICTKCGNSHSHVAINDSTVIKEFSVNYYVEPHDGCGWTEDQRYCVLVKWDDFIKSPDIYIDKAYNKRDADIAKKVKVYPK